jgi:hypothetical protein
MSDERKEMRLAIAKDVLARLDNGTLKPQTGDYWRFIDKSLKTKLNGQEISKHIDELLKGCTACALGGMLIAHIAINNKCVFESMWGENSFASRELPRLEEFFTRKQLAIIEIMFEGNSSCYETQDVEENEVKLFNDNARWFYQEHYDDSPEHRLRLIMQMLINNDGTVDNMG